MSRKKSAEKLYPLAFRLRKSERLALKELAREWQTSQVGVIRRLLAMAAETEQEGARNGRTK